MSSPVFSLFIRMHKPISKMKSGSEFDLVLLANVLVLSFATAHEVWNDG